MLLALEQQRDVADRSPVLLFRLNARIQPDLAVEVYLSFCHLRPFAADRSRRVIEPEKLPHDLQRLAQRLSARERPEVVRDLPCRELLGEVLPAHDQDTRKLVVRNDEVVEALVVFCDRVEARFVRTDEVRLKDERLEYGVRHRPLERLRLRDHLLDEFASLRPDIVREVAADTVPKRRRLADVEYLLPLPEKEIHARCVRYLLLCDALACHAHQYSKMYACTPTAVLS